MAKGRRRCGRSGEMSSPVSTITTALGTQLPSIAIDCAVYFTRGRTMQLVDAMMNAPPEFLKQFSRWDVDRIGYMQKAIRDANGWAD